MANNKLEDKIFVIPDHVIKTVKPGTMRSDFVIRRKDGLSYYNIKRLKNFFDNHTEKDPDTHQALGEDLKKWVNTTLDTYRGSMNKGKRIKSDIGMLNVFKAAHTKDKGKGSFKVRLPKPQTNARQIFTGKGLYENIDNNDDVVSSSFYDLIKRDYDFYYLSQPFKHKDQYIIDIIVDDTITSDEFTLHFIDGEIYQDMLGEVFDIDSYKYFSNLINSLYPNSIRKIPEKAPKLLTQKGMNENEYDVFTLGGESKIELLSNMLDESLIDKYLLMIESPFYDGVDDIISDIIYFENKTKKYKK